VCDDGRLLLKSAPPVHAAVKNKCASERDHDGIMIIPYVAATT